MRSASPILVPVAAALGVCATSSVSCDRPSEPPRGDDGQDDQGRAHEGEGEAPPSPQVAPAEASSDGFRLRSATVVTAAGTRAGPGAAATTIRGAPIPPGTTATSRSYRLRTIGPGAAP